MTHHPGSCFCGAVQYRLTADPMFVHACHCRDCQKQTGGPFAINAIIEAAHVEILAGEPAATAMTTDSGGAHDIYRCTDCGSALWSDYGRRGTILFVRAATLDAPDRCPPDVHIFTRSKLACVDIPDGARVFKGYYDPKKERSPATQERWRAALNRG